MDSPEQAFLTDTELLEWLSNCEPAAPRDIAESRRRENVIRLQCRQLRDCGLLQQVTHDVYELTQRGRKHVGGELDLPETDGDLPVELSRIAPRWQRDDDRITDVDGIDAETIIAFNFERYEDEVDQYGLVQNSRRITKRRIGNVSERDVDRVLREFPRQEPLVQQCAHWVRAISGLHFFPDANHRTAMGSLRALLYLNDISAPDEWPGHEINRTILKAKFIRNFVVDVRFDTLWEKDELYHLWHRHFRNLFFDLEPTSVHKHSTTRLGNALDAARKQG
ncbi:hypothetical protein [Halorussus amylolyticus]|uniref:hypothetical protein n=1 Tax=Halorussus amylolyticus TaxID=1126242 RepID=UPI00104562DB|nr:hypothetical protein [Halorussus amylolyticus]